jgi:hypothetical protein
MSSTSHRRKRTNLEIALFKAFLVGSVVALLYSLPQILQAQMRLDIVSLSRMVTREISLIWKEIIEP